MREPAFWHRPPSLLSRLLMPFGFIYGTVAAERLKREGINAGVPVLCVGNFTLGGAGKTPTVLALAKLLQEIGEVPVVLSRGYGGSLRGPIKVDTAVHIASQVGDEPLMMASTLRVVVSRDRTDGVALARSLGASIIVMDDGFQNPAVIKDVSLIVVDSERGLGNGHVFPAGPLRAPLPPQLARTDALVIVGEGGVSDTVAASITAQSKPVFRARFKANDASVETLRGKRVLAFAGIGDPGRFFRTLRANRVQVIAEQPFADHHMFSRDEISRLTAEAKRSALTLVTTEKDIARIAGDPDLASHVQDIVPFAVTLEFDDVALLRKFLINRLFQAREKTR